MLIFLKILIIDAFKLKLIEIFFKSLMGMKTLYVNGFFLK
jgi:hypothetical protein